MLDPVGPRKIVNAACVFGSIYVLFLWKSWIEAIQKTRDLYASSKKLSESRRSGILIYNILMSISI